MVTTFVRGKSGFTDGVADNELGDEWGAYDLGLQNAYFCLKAREMGLDTLIMGIRDAKAIRDELGIPTEEEIVAVIAVGYRAVDPKTRPRMATEDILKFF